MFGNWQVEREKSFRPFHTKDIEPILKAAPNVMNQNLHRLLLEDSMMLNPGDKLICLIQSNHSFLSSPGLLKKQWIPLLKEVMTIEPMHPVQFQTSLFFPFSPWEVRNHPTRMTKKTEMEILCKGTGTGSGGGRNSWVVGKWSYKRDQIPATIKVPTADNVLEEGIYFEFNASEEGDRKYK